MRLLRNLLVLRTAFLVVVSNARVIYLALHAAYMFTVVDSWAQVILLLCEALFVCERCSCARA